MKNNKKGISPLIATVLIIGFTVALAAVIMTWGSSFTKSIQSGQEEATKQQLACAQKVSLSIKSGCLTKDFKSIQMILENKGSIDIKKIKFRLYENANSVSTKDLADFDKITGNQALTSFAIKTITVSPTNPKDIKKIEAIPTVSVDSKEVTCAGAMVSYGDLSGSGLSACL